MIKSLGPECGTELSKSLGVRVGKGTLSTMFTSAEEGIAKLGGRIGAETGETVLVMAGRAATSAMTTILDAIDPLLWTVDIALIAVSLVDLISDAVPYHYGTCNATDNKCYGNGTAAPCEYKYSCQSKGAKCALRSIHPAKVVCNWNDYETWTKKAGVQPTMAAIKSWWGWTQANAYRFAKDKVQHWQTIHDQCIVTGTVKACKTSEKELKKWQGRERRRAKRMDYMKSPRHAREAKHLWEKAEVLSKKYRKAHQLAQETDKHRNLTIAIERPKAAQHYMNSLAKEMFHNERHLREELVKTIRKARQLSFKADPLGMTYMVTKRLDPGNEMAPNITTTTMMNTTANTTSLKISPPVIELTTFTTSRTTARAASSFATASNKARNSTLIRDICTG